MHIEKIKMVLIDQQKEIDALFTDEKIIKRAVPDISRYLEHPNILAVLGIRRGGKSVFSIQISAGMKYGYVNFDDERLMDLKTEDLNSILMALYDIHGRGIDRFIFDEIHNVTGWELFLNRLRRTKRVVVTGSNSKMLSGDLATHLTGRYIDITLFPFSFREYLALKEFTAFERGNHSSTDVSEIQQHLDGYMMMGGMPEAHRFGKGILSRIYQDIIYKDIVVRHNIRAQATFQELSRYLISNSSREITYNRLKNVVDIKDVHTVKNYVDYLASAYLIVVLERYSSKLKESMKAPKKVYCTDTGITVALSSGASLGKGRVMENVVLIELLRRRSYADSEDRVFYWKDHQQREVDFVVVSGGKARELLQVCYDPNDPDTERRELEGFLQASKQLRCKKMTMITWNDEKTMEYKGAKIEYIPLWKWLLDGGGKIN